MKLISATMGPYIRKVLAVGRRACVASAVAHRTRLPDSVVITVEVV